MNCKHLQRRTYPERAPQRLVSELESHRAKLLIKDELGFLAEDLYDVSAY